MDYYQRVNIYYAVTCRLVVNMDDVFKQTAEFCILPTSDITAQFKILLTSDITDFCTNIEMNFEYCRHLILLTSVQIYR